MTVRYSARYIDKLFAEQEPRVHLPNNRSCFPDATIAGRILVVLPNLRVGPVELRRVAVL